MKFDIDTYVYPKFLNDVGLKEIEGHYPSFDPKFPSEIFYYKNKENFNKKIMTKSSIDYYLFKYYPDIKYYEYVKVFNMNFKDILYSDFESRKKSYQNKISVDLGLIPKKKPSIKKIA